MTLFCDAPNFDWLKNKVLAIGNIFLNQADVAGKGNTSGKPDPWVLSKKFQANFWAKPIISCLLNDANKLA